jgi:succinate-semialdehyde dehydrogenase/glutarate-semialdehyde dehydrogenase
MDIGPFIDRAGVDNAEVHVADAVCKGARLLCGAKAIPGNGFNFQPTVLADVSPGSACMRDETFAPVVPVCAFDSEKEAVELANDAI